MAAISKSILSLILLAASATASPLTARADTVFSLTDISLTFSSTYTTPAHISLYTSDLSFTSTNEAIGRVNNCHGRWLLFCVRKDYLLSLNSCGHQHPSGYLFQRPNKICLWRRRDQFQLHISEWCRLGYLHHCRWYVSFLPSPWLSNDSNFWE